ncbi:MAG: cytochrome c biogenesis protein CcdA [Azospirillum sp.]|nr:cytochrome c biogenesis protein CcdA [Azospirillum sp.]
MTGFDVSYAGALGAGLLSFLSPCILPLVPPYLAFISGVSLGGGSGPAATAGRVLPPALAFVLGFMTVFVALGATASTLGRYIAVYSNVLTPLAGGIIIVLGLHFLGVFRIFLLFREARFHVESRPVGLLGAYVVGLAFAFGWTPCVGPVLAAILIVAGSGDDAWFGASLLGSYAAGIGIPFLAAAAAVGSLAGPLGRLKRVTPVVEKVLGVLLIATGLLFITGGIVDVSNWLLETFPVLGRIG